MALKTQPQNGFTASRRWRRFRFDVPVRVVLRRDGRDVEFAGRGTGMNEGGIGIYAEAPLQEGDLVQVEFTPPYSGLTVSVRGMLGSARRPGAAARSSASHALRRPGDAGRSGACPEGGTGR